MNATLQIPEQHLEALEVACEDASRKANELKSEFESADRVKRTLEGILSALTESRVFWALDLICFDNYALVDFLKSRGYDPLILKDLENRLQEVAERVWLDYPKLLEQSCQDVGLQLDHGSRHPNYSFSNGFLLVQVKRQENTITAVITSNERKVAQIPADIQAVTERVKRQEVRLFSRPFDGHKLLETLRKHYLETLKKKGLSDGAPVAIKGLARRVVKTQRGYRLDEFVVDLSRLIREGPTDIDGRKLRLRSTRNEKDGIMLHNVDGLAYVGSLMFSRR